MLLLYSTKTDANFIPLEIKTLIFYKTICYDYGKGTLGRALMEASLVHSLRRCILPDPGYDGVQGEGCDDIAEPVSLSLPITPCRHLGGKEPVRFWYARSYKQTKPRKAENSLK